MHSQLKLCYLFLILFCQNQVSTINLKFNSMFKPIPFERFINFHHEFQVDTIDICKQCGGKCETSKIGSLMPGEAEYVATNLTMNLDEFRDRYLDGINTPYGIVDVLKITPTCPFLGTDFSCSIKEFKPVLCETYPILFYIQKNKVNFYLDDWCPMVRHKDKIAQIFEKKGIPAIKRIGAEIKWYKAVETFDPLFFDYNKLHERRVTNKGYKIFSLEEVLSFEIFLTPPSLPKS